MNPPRTTDPPPFHQWGANLDPASRDQMRSAMALSVTAAGALMPDAHVGYGLPIGGVLATRNCVIPYAVGVDIACRMKLTVLDLPCSMLENDPHRRALARAIEHETRFGIGCTFETPHHHDVLDEDWSVSPITVALKDKARAQLGTSGSGNHFVEFGTLTVYDNVDAQRDLHLQPGAFLALLSHSGSRGTGAAVCNHYSRLAQHLTGAHLSKQQAHLAWLTLDSQEGNEYWCAMQLMGRYAAANHELIHRSIARHLGAQVIADVENHHNFAWKERHPTAPDGAEEEVIIHRKGATPAGTGILGVIPGSMASPGFVVRGLGSPASLRSASHGAGRAMSRTRAKKTINWNSVRARLDAKGITLLSAGIDEAPDVYKDIHTVMAEQTDLVQPIARFDPRIVKMAPEGERPED